MGKLWTRSILYVIIKEKLLVRYVMQDKIMGCIYGGAIGDAMGYPIEFYRDSELKTLF